MWGLTGIETPLFSSTDKVVFLVYDEIAEEPVVAFSVYSIPVFPYQSSLYSSSVFKSLSGLSSP